MKRFSSQYIITNTGPPLKRAVLSVEDDGTVINIEDTGGNLEEKHEVEFYNGIIIPGFVNCHCHLELSHMKGTIAEGGGLGKFLENIRSGRENTSENIVYSALSADNDMHREGTVLCADICNTSITFNIKKTSKISYINLLEVFGMDPEKAGRRMDEIIRISQTAYSMNLPFEIVPHTAYTMSLPLFRLLREKSGTNRITSIHFMETQGEKAFLANHSGPLMDSFKLSGFIPSGFETVKNHADAVLNEVTPSGNMILVHNTFADRETIKMVQKRGNLYFCLCPNSNIYIENKIPPLDMLLEEGCEIVIGTDSLASNRNLSILGELRTLQQYFPSLSIQELVCMATANGAKALGLDDQFGKIGVGKKPGLLLLQGIDLLNMKLLPDSYVTWLI